MVFVGKSVRRWRRTITISRTLGPILTRLMILIEPSTVSNSSRSPGRLRTTRTKLRDLRLKELRDRAMDWVGQCQIRKRTLMVTSSNASRIKGASTVALQNISPETARARPVQTTAKTRTERKALLANTRTKARPLTGEGREKPSIP